MNVLENFPYIRKKFSFEKIDVIEGGHRVGVGVNIKISRRKLYKIIPKKTDGKILYDVSINNKDTNTIDGRDLGRLLKRLYISINSV